MSHDGGRSCSAATMRSVTASSSPGSARITSASTNRSRPRLDSVPSVTFSSCECVHASSSHLMAGSSPGCRSTGPLTSGWLRDMVSIAVSAASARPSASDTRSSGRAPSARCAAAAGGRVYKDAEGGAARLDGVGAAGGDAVHYDRRDVRDGQRLLLARGAVDDDGRQDARRKVEDDAGLGAHEVAQRLPDALRQLRRGVRRARRLELGVDGACARLRRLRLDALLQERHQVPYRRFYLRRQRGGP
ncbi:MAG: hypothetical protein J3K34DRAFT_433520 [Monoraphidium minutum]|nr:MAG: hypothetical protein J3K34DRAFT_433520 [Monoraphidium minutum]